MTRQVFVLQDEGTFHLKEAAKNLLKSLGSLVSLNLSWRDMWTLVVKKGGRGASFHFTLPMDVTLFIAYWHPDTMRLSTKELS